MAFLIVMMLFGAQACNASMLSTIQMFQVFLNHAWNVHTKVFLLIYFQLRNDNNCRCIEQQEYWISQTWVSIMELLGTIYPSRWMPLPQSNPWVSRR